MPKMVSKFPVAFPGRQVEKCTFPYRKPTAYITLPCATALACDQPIRTWTVEHDNWHVVNLFVDQRATHKDGSSSTSQHFLEARDWPNAECGHDGPKHLDRSQTGHRWNDHNVREPPRCARFHVWRKDSEILEEGKLIFTARSILLGISLFESWQGVFVRRVKKVKQSEPIFGTTAGPSFCYTKFGRLSVRLSHGRSVTTPFNRSKQSWCRWKAPKF